MHTQIRFHDEHLNVQMYACMNIPESLHNKYLFYNVFNIMHMHKHYACAYVCKCTYAHKNIHIRLYDKWPSVRTKYLMPKCMHAWTYLEVYQINIVHLRTYANAHTRINICIQSYDEWPVYASMKIPEILWDKCYADTEKRNPRHCSCLHAEACW